MKPLFVLFILIFSGLCFSQSDTIALNTPAIFSITFREDKNTLFSINEYTTYDEVYLDLLTADYVTFRKKFSDENNPNAISRIGRIYLKDIKSLGYATGTQETFGGLLGMGLGFLGGTAVAIIARSMDRGAYDQNYDSTTSKSFTTPMLIGFGSGAILGYIIGGHSNEYKTFELSTFSNEKKYLEINKIVKKGLNYPRKK